MDLFHTKIDKNMLKILEFGPKKSQLWWDIPAEDTFDLLKDIYNISDEEFQKNRGRTYYPT